MPRISEGWILLLALILGAITAGLIVAYLSSRDEGTTSEPAPVLTSFVIVAAEDLEAGEKIAASMIEVQTVPRDLAIEGSFFSRSLVEGKTVRYPIERGEQITETRLVETSTEDLLSAQLTPGTRAITIPVDIENSPAALMVPGDFVDIILTVDVDSVHPDAFEEPLPPFDTERRDELKAVFVLYQNIQVLSLNRAFVENGVVYDESVRGELPEEEGVGYVTLALTTEQAQYIRLALSDRDAILTLSLRPFGDNEIEEDLPIVLEPYLAPAPAEEATQEGQ
jgi:pilus assembly protein CpaB